MLPLHFTSLTSLHVNSNLNSNHKSSQLTTNHIITFHFYYQNKQTSNAKNYYYISWPTKKNIHAIYATSFQPSKQEHNANNFTARKKKIGSVIC